MRKLTEYRQNRGDWSMVKLALHSSSVGGSTGYYKKSDVDETINKLKAKFANAFADLHETYARQGKQDGVSYEVLEQTRDCLLQRYVDRINASYDRIQIVVSDLSEIQRLTEQNKVLNRLLNECCNTLDIVAAGKGAGGETIDRTNFVAGFNMYLAEEWGAVRDDVEITSGDSQGT